MSSRPDGEKRGGRVINIREDGSGEEDDIRGTVVENSESKSLCVFTLLLRNSTWTAVV